MEGWRTTRGRYSPRGPSGTTGSSSTSFQVINVPSNAHISTPFFHKTVFFSKIFFGKPGTKPPSKFLEVCLNSEYL